MPDQDSGGFLSWLFGSKPAETPEQAAARKKKEEQDKKATDSIQQAIRGYGTLKKVVKDAQDANAKQPAKKQ